MNIRIDNKVGCAWVRQVCKFKHLKIKSILKLYQFLQRVYRHFVVLYHHFRITRNFKTDISSEKCLSVLIYFFIWVVFSVKLHSSGIYIRKIVFFRFFNSSFQINQIYENRDSNNRHICTITVLVSENSYNFIYRYMQYYEVPGHLVIRSRLQHLYYGTYIVIPQFLN